MLASGGHAGTRNSVLTLVTHTRTIRGGGGAHAARYRIAHHNPPASVVSSSSTLIAQNPSGKPLEAFIKTSTQSANGATSFGEQIWLERDTGGRTAPAGSILPLIVSGLPSFLWVEGTMRPWNANIFEATLIWL